MSLSILSEMRRMMLIYGVDDVLITETGYDDLTSTPKTVAEVESLLSS